MPNYELIISSVHEGRATPQCGKTTYAACEYINDILDKNRFPMYFAYNYKTILTDFILKAEQKAKELTNERIHILNPADKSSARKFKRVKEMFISGTELYKYKGLAYEKSIGMAGLSNQYYLSKLCSILLASEDMEPIGYMDEYDEHELGFNARREVRHKMEGRNFRKGEVGFHRLLQRTSPYFSTLKLISATNLAAAISDIPKFDSIKTIVPEKGYTNNINYFIVKKADIHALKQGRLSPKIEEFYNMLNHNLMVNVTQGITDHKIIAGAFPLPGTYLVNMEADFYFDSLKQGRNVVIGGRMFGRGATYHRLDGLILDKLSSNMTNVIQAAGRLFGYKDYPIFIACTQQQCDMLESSFEFETKISDAELLNLEVSERHKAISSFKANKTITILSDNNNGWKSRPSRKGNTQVLVRHRKT
jgi:hypothetical protein